jgi:mono/diheme cytochrome c family protein
MVLAVVLLTVAVSKQQSVKNSPVRYTSPASSSDMYKSYCAACHGVDGRGNGPAVPALKVAPPDLTTLAKRNNGKYPSDHVAAILEGKVTLAAHGSKEMPVWGPIFMQLGEGHPGEVQQRVTNLTKYIEVMQVN